MDEEFDEEFEAKSGSKKIILLVVLALVLLGGGGVAAYLSGMLESDDVHEERAKADAPAVSEVYYDLPTMVSNLAGERGRPRFLKFAVSLALTDPAAIPWLRRFEPRIFDILQIYFRDLRLDDLRESRGIPIVRHELLLRINSAIRPAAITSVLLNEVMIQ